jgi:hypothetical protein
MRAHALNAARRLGKEHGHAHDAPVYTPRTCNQIPLRKRYWEARGRAERDGTIFIWHECTRLPASLYAAANCPRATIVVSTDPTIRTDPKRGSVRYHFG